MSRHRGLVACLAAGAALTVAGGGTPATADSLPLRSLFRDGVRRGRYELAGSYRGTRTSLRFTVV
jgi:hypothetical protein